LLVDGIRKLEWGGRRSWGRREEAPAARGGGGGDGVRRRDGTWMRDFIGFFVLGFIAFERRTCLLGRTEAIGRL
jgi:hypothetical protein